MFTIPHPRRLLKALPPHLRRQAAREYRAIAGSGMHLDRLAMLSSWYRRAGLPEVRELLERVFREVARDA
ncbi:hypothetical protein EDD75_1372 [Thermodesulfitimonas autotrophica]|uniref:Uncharacterized protein n=1 Tax=Thermodesulfitimonas autotrophica TaxID=1894989 RepID=A0A3N5ATZ0_9THEO|nr:hypothetical protein [Thermodesulfitimonas autotrophica]RPF47100.1 hypothetical protein EDD75_1372 [Thermodesulfitimonas autotrophica]